MGSNFVTVILNAGTEKKLEDDFLKYSIAETEQYGNSIYSGHIGTKRGIVVKNKKFQNITEAKKYLEDTCSKYDEYACAVKVGDFNKYPIENAKIKKTEDSIESLKKDIKDYEKNVINILKGKGKEYISCKCCGSKLAVKFIKEISCPLCNDAKFTNNKKLEAKLSKDIKALKENKEFLDNLYIKLKEKRKDEVVCWFVGAICRD